MVVKISTSYLYPDGGTIELFFDLETQTLTDLGETSRWLWQKMELSLENYCVEQTLNAYSICLVDGALSTKVQGNLPDGIDRLSQAIIVITYPNNTLTYSPQLKLDDSPSLTLTA